MHIRKAEKPQAASDARADKTERLTNNGMHRDRTDKNAVDDEHDFASLRAQLGKKKAAPKTDEVKLARAAASTGLQPGKAQDTNQMFVQGKTKSQAAGDVRADTSRDRLTNNGMHRDRSDKNQEADEFDFAAMRANLGKARK